MACSRSNADCATFTSHDGDFSGTGMIPDPLGDVVLVDHEWSAAADRAALAGGPPGPA